MKSLGHRGEGLHEIFPEDGSDPIHHRAAPYNKRLKIVCYRCNNEWMSAMEESAKPLLLAMLDEGTPIDLDVHASRTLARWAFKTATVLGEVNSSGIVPERHRREFAETDTIPRHVLVHAARAAETGAPGNPNPLASSRPLLGTVVYGNGTFDYSEADESVRASYYRVVFRNLNTVFDVLGYIGSDVNLIFRSYEYLQDYLLPIWPTQEAAVTWPPRGNLDYIGGVTGLINLPLDVELPA